MLRLVERERVLGDHEVEGLQDQLVARVQVVRQLRDRRLAAEQVRQLAAGVLDLQGELLEPAGNPQRPRGVAEMPPQLTQDRRHREAAECGSAVGIEAVDRLQEADAGDLLEVLDRLLGAPVAAGEAAGERQIALEHPVARRRARVGAEAREQPALLVLCRCIHASPDGVASPRGYTLGGCPVSIMTMRSTSTLLGIRIVDSPALSVVAAPSMRTISPRTSPTRIVWPTSKSARA